MYQGYRVLSCSTTNSFGQVRQSLYQSDLEATSLKRKIRTKKTFMSSVYVGKVSTGGFEMFVLCVITVARSY